MKFLTLTAFFILSTAQANVYTVDCRDLNKFCTEEFAPSKCTYGNSLVAKGSNQCSATLKIESALCAAASSNTVKVDTKKLKCSPTL